MNPNRHGIRENFVYWLFDEEDVCLYVGRTRRPEQRWAAHRRERAAMVSRVAYRRMAGPFDADTARKLEREQQEDLQPVYDMVQGHMRARHRHLPTAQTKWVWANMPGSEQ